MSNPFNPKQKSCRSNASASLRPSADPTDKFIDDFDLLEALITIDYFDLLEALVTIDHFDLVEEDSYDNALAESFNGLYKTALIHCKGAWRNIEHVEEPTSTICDWRLQH